MKKNSLALFLMLHLILATVGCPKGEKITSVSSETSQSKTSETGEPSVSSPKKGEKEKYMVATVNGTAILNLEVDRETKNLMHQLGDKIRPGQELQMRPVIQKQAIENLIVRTLLLQEANKQKIEATETQIEAKITEIRSRFKTPEQFQQQLTTSGHTAEKFRREIGQNLKIEDLLDKQFVSIKKVNDEDIAAFYNENPKEFEVQDQIRASHILISIKPEEDQAAREKKRQMLADLKKQIDQGGDFAELAKKHSSCPSNSKGGDLGFFSQGQMVKEFETVAFNLKKDQISDVVDTKFGFHLIKVTDKREKHSIPLEQVKDKVGTFLTGKKKQEVLKKYVAQLRESADITYAEAPKP